VYRVLEATVAYAMLVCTFYYYYYYYIVYWHFYTAKGGVFAIWFGQSHKTPRLYFRSLMWQYLTSYGMEFK